MRLKPKIRAAELSGKPTAVLVGFSDWKKWMHDALFDYNVIFLGYSPRVADELLEAIPRFPDVTVFVWSYKYPEILNEICKRHGIPVIYVEDGFIRSIGLGIAKSAPLSLVYDKRGLHFDRDRVSDLDELLNTTDFSTMPVTLELADRVIELVKDGMTKYIKADGEVDIVDQVITEAGVKNILVLGQVEDDMSIRRGMETIINCNEFVKLVALENPHANIFYKPHPEAVARNKKHYSKPTDVNNICQILGSRWTLNETLSIADEVHTMTSLAGFEAAMRGIPVHTYGMPFYAGWGFTTDHGLSANLEKRRRKITLREAVAGAYVLYPRYLDPISKKPISPNRGIEIAAGMNTQLRNKRRIQHCINDRNEKRKLAASEVITNTVLEEPSEEEILTNSIKNILHYLNSKR